MGKTRPMFVAAVRRLCVLGTILGAIGPVSAEPTHSADIVILHAKVYTVNPREPWAQAVAIRGGKIVAVGTDEQIEPLRGSSTKVIDAAQRMVLPGLIDAHVHFFSAAWESVAFEVSGSSVAEVQEKLRAHIADNPKETVTVASAAFLKQAGELTKQDLDAVESKHPIAIFDGHDCWLNSKALQILGITRNTPKPRGGSIVHDPKTGDTTGLVLDYAARGAYFKIAERAANAPNAEGKKAGYRSVIQLYNSLGFTRAFSADFDYVDIDLLDQLRRDGGLTLRMNVATLLLPPALVPAELDRVEQLRQTHKDAWLDMNAIKLYQDALVETHGGAMIEPYSDRPNERGASVWSPQQLNATVTELDRRGFKILIHATGDRAVREALDAYEQAEHTNGRNAVVKRIEHVEHTTDQDLPRFAQLGVIASMQPNFEDEIVWNGAVAVLGEERMRLAMPWASLENAGATVAFNSDFPSRFDPWVTIQTSLTRVPHPEQRVSLAQAIAAYTINSARAAGVETTEGSIEVGKSADIILISQNLFEVEPHTIISTKVVNTIVDGRVVYSQP